MVWFGFYNFDDDKKVMKTFFWRKLMAIKKETELEQASNEHTSMFHPIQPNSMQFKFYYLVKTEK